MKTRTTIFIVLVILVVAAVIGIRFLRGPGKSLQESGSPQAELPPASGGLASLRGAEVHWPLLFIPNRGQLDPRVAFYLQGGDKNIYFGPEGLTITMASLKEKGGTSPAGGDSGLKKAELPSRVTGVPGTAGQEREFRRWTVRMDFVGANPATVIKPLKQVETRMSYFRGGPDDWFSALPTYSLIRYEELWPGVDLYLKGNPGQLKCEFVVSPGTDPSVIRLNYRGQPRSG